MDSKASPLRLSFLLAVWGLTSTSLHAQITNLVANGSFELPVLTAGANYFVPANDLAPWQTTDISFEVWAPNLSVESPADGRQHLEILSQTNTATVWQSFATVEGQDYSFHFRHSPRPGVNSAMSVSLDGRTIAMFAENGSELTAFKWQRFRTNFTALSNLTTIAFTDTSADASGTHLDDVVLERLPVNSTIRVSDVEVRWESVATKLYQVQYRSTVTTNLWMDLSGPIQGNGGTIVFKDSVPDDGTQRFYRVSTIP